MGKALKKKLSGKKILIPALAFGAILLTFAGGQKVFAPSYRVERVIDGDTFVTKSGQYVRVAAIEAPEKGRCGYIEAKKKLTELIMNKNVYLKVYYLDPYKRMVAGVYTQDGLVNSRMTRGGYAYFIRGVEEIGDEIRKNGDMARSEKLGIYSKKCTQSENPKNKGCDIKGNDRNGKIYYTKSCRIYSEVYVQLYLGDKWICTEKEALDGGFRRAKQC